MPESRRWTRDELIIALNLYHKLTFGQLHARNPVVCALAEKLGRTPSSVGMKLCNFASFDPALQLRGIKGLQGASALDRTIWDEFYSDLNEAAPASETALRALFDAGEDTELEIIPKEGIRMMKRHPSGPTEVYANVKIRRGQSYFREAVLNNFNGCCAITGLSIRELLIASHILPWGTHPEHRLNLRNGLCLSRLHDAAFDQGLITFDEELRLVLSPRLKSELSQQSLSQNFGDYMGKNLLLPVEAIPPDQEFLEKHREHLFLKN